MKISIVTVVKNAGKTIEDTIRSVISQTYPDVEYIVIDGGSTDNTLGIIEKYRNNISRLIIEKDDGVFDAMNKGFSSFSGDIIGFLNADDVYTCPEILQHVADELKNEAVDICFGDVAYINQKNKSKIIRYYSSSSFTKDKIKYGFMPPHPSLFIKRCVYEEFGGFKSDYKIAGDFELMARFFTNKTIRYRYLPINMVKMSDGGISTTLKNKLKLNKEVLKACVDNGIKTDYVKIYSKYVIKIFEYISRPKHGF
jgi:glycosyltransferase involved in cell wall biosynthesis